jgi:hypothetical protein
MTNGRHTNPASRLKVMVAVATLAGATGAALLFALHEPARAPLVPVERASPAQMRQAMARLQDDHAALNRFLERKQSETEAKDAEQARALEAARVEAANEARRKAEAAAAYEAAQLAAAQRKLEATAPKPEPRRPEETAVAVPATPAGSPLPITPPVVQQKRGPLDRAIETANRWTDKTIGAAGAVVNFFTSAAGKLVGAERPSSNLSSSW